MLAARHSRRQQRRAYVYSESNSESISHAQRDSDRKTKGYAEAKANTRASGLSGT
jgi:hypothetical protein